MNIRKYGKPPFRVAVLHGGPGAPGYMAPVARELSKKRGILEPLQTSDSLEGQVAELKDQLVHHADTPVILIGSSWGAVLALFFASQFPELVSKLILIGSAAFDRKNSEKIEAIRMARLTADERRRYDELSAKLEHASGQNKAMIAGEWGRILFRTDMYNPLRDDTETLEVQFDINRKVWADFVVLRDKPGFLKERFSRIKVPVVIIHGDYDPHPVEGIRPFLEECLPDTHFYLLSKCGHYPWLERHAYKYFYDILERELQ